MNGAKSINKRHRKYHFAKTKPLAKSMYQQKHNDKFARKIGASLNRRSKFRSKAARSGVAAVEAAFCFPVIVILMLGTLEITSGLFLRESLSICSFEACRVGTRRGSTATDVQDRAIEVLADRGVTSATVTITPSNFDDLVSLDAISVSITAPTAGNSIFVFDNLANRSISSSVAMVREFDE